MKKHHKSCGKLTRWWSLASIAWIAFILWRAESYYPSVPLDIDGHNPAVLAAFASAVRRYYFATTLLALGVPALAYGLGFLSLPVPGWAVSDGHCGRAPRWWPKPYRADAPWREDRRPRRHPFVRRGSGARRASRDLYPANVRQAGLHFCRRPLETLDTFYRNRRASRGRGRARRPARHRGR